MADCMVKAGQRVRRAQAAASEMLRDPRLVEVLAAQLDEQAARHEFQAAQARTHAVRAEVAGDAEGVEAWCEIAESHAAHAALMRRQRAQIVGRFCSPPAAPDAEA